MSALVIVATLVMLLWMLGPPIEIDHHRGIPRLPARKPNPLPSPPPLLSVIIPARNEERRIASCVTSVLAQDHPNFEVVVVDDRSSDATASIVAGIAAKDARLKLVNGAECPPGWAGKNHALVQGVAASAGAHILLLDADVTLGRGCLRESHALAIASGAGLTTALLGTSFTGFWERLLQPLMYEMMLFLIPPDQVNDPAFPDVAMAPGPFLLFRRDAYDAIGGHGSMKGEIVEDLMLARKVKSAGLGLVLADGTRIAELAREVSLARLWEGWSRVTFKGLDQKLAVVVGGTLGVSVMMLLPWVIVPLGLWHAWHAPSAFPGMLLATIGATTVAAQAGCRWLLDLYYGIDRASFWLTPLAAAFAIAVLWNSALVSRGNRTVVWKGRTYGGGTGASA